MLAIFLKYILSSGLFKTWFKQKNLDARPIHTIVDFLSRCVYIFLASKCYILYYELFF